MHLQEDEVDVFFPIPPAKYKWKQRTFYVYEKIKTLKDSERWKGAAEQQGTTGPKNNRDETSQPRRRRGLILLFTEKPIVVQLNQYCVLVNGETTLTDINQQGLQWDSWDPCSSVSLRQLDHDQNDLIMPNFVSKPRGEGSTGVFLFMQTIPVPFFFYVAHFLTPLHRSCKILSSPLTPCGLSFLLKIRRQWLLLSSNL